MHLGESPSKLFRKTLARGQNDALPVCKGRELTTGSQHVQGGFQDAGLQTVGKRRPRQTADDRVDLVDLIVSAQIRNRLSRILDHIDLRATGSRDRSQFGRPFDRKELCVFVQMVLNGLGEDAGPRPEFDDPASVFPIKPFDHSFDQTGAAGPNRPHLVRVSSEIFDERPCTTARNFGTIWRVL